MSICTSVPAAGASAIPLAIVIIGVVLTYCVAAYLLFLLIRALRKYIKSDMTYIAKNTSELVNNN